MLPKDGVFVAGWCCHSYEALTHLALRVIPLPVYPLLLGTHMKLFLLTAVLLTVSLTSAPAANGTAPTHRASLVKDTAITGSDVQFAQLEAPAGAPISSTGLLTVVAVLVVGLRLLGLNRARAMADRERHSYHGRAQMFRSLHEERSSQS